MFIAPFVEHWDLRVRPASPDSALACMNMMTQAHSRKSGFLLRGVNSYTHLAIRRGLLLLPRKGKKPPDSIDMT